MVDVDAWFLPIVTAYNPVWVEHRNELEDKHVSQGVSSRVVSSEDQAEETLKHKGCGSLPWVHAAAEEKHLDAQQLEQ